MSTEKITISIFDIKNKLNNGVTRRPGDSGYNPELGSIQEHYKLTTSEVAQLFKHPLLAGLKVKKPSRLVIVEGPVEENKTTYGAPSNAAKDRLATSVAPVPADTPVLTEEELSELHALPHSPEAVRADSGSSETSVASVSSVESESVEEVGENVVESSEEPVSF